MSVSDNQNHHNKEDRFTLSEVKLKIARYCAYQERAHSEVVNKLYQLNLHRDEVEEVIAWLITENYLNEERYAIALAGGKFRIKQWGRFKIKQYLNQKAVSEYSINKALNELDEEEYRKTIENLILKKATSVRAENIYQKRHKVASYLISKGFEPEIVWEQIMKIIV